jgi:hypothetical protein
MAEDLFYVQEKMEMKVYKLQKPKLIFRRVDTLVFTTSIC